MKRLPEITKILKDKQFKSKIKIFMSEKTTGADFNPYEKNYTFTNSNPITAYGYKKEISPSSLVYRQMGQKNMGAVELIADTKFKQYFVLSNKVEIDDQEYEVYKEAVGNRASIQDQPYKMIRVILSKK